MLLNNNSIEFMAIIKQDQRALDSNITYFLLDHKRVIQGVSGSILTNMNMDLHLAKRLSISDINMDVMAP